VNEWSVVNAAVITGGGICTTTIETTALTVPPALAAEIVTLLVPVAVKVPLINPLAGSRLNPAGSPVVPKLGLFEAVI
jgi:hypothetical protein